MKKAQRLAGEESFAQYTLPGNEHGMRPGHTSTCWVSSVLIHLFRYLSFR